MSVIQVVKTVVLKKVLQIVQFAMMTMYSNLGKPMKTKEHASFIVMNSLS